MEFCKEEFKSEVKNNLKVLFRRSIEDASQVQLFQAVAYAVKDYIVDMWMETHKQYEKQDAKTVYYLSMEFLMPALPGRADRAVPSRKQNPPDAASIPPVVSSAIPTPSLAPPSLPSDRRQRASFP